MRTSSLPKKTRVKEIFRHLYSILGDRIEKFVSYKFLKLKICKFEISEFTLCYTAIFLGKSTHLAAVYSEIDQLIIYLSVPLSNPPLK